MIEKIINKGYYKFSGSIHSLKNHLGGFKITNVITDGEIQGISIFSAEAEFRYHSARHRITITSDFGNKNILHIEYKGRKNI